MNDRELEGLSTTAKLGEHPLHPMLVPFPIALLVATFACDLVFWWTGNDFWAQAAFWSLGAAIVTALIAAVAGFMDLLGNARIRALSDAWRHMLGNLLAVVLAGVNLWLRYDEGAAAAIVPWGLALSAIIVVILLYTGWKGGELVYRYRVGMQSDDSAGRHAVQAEGLQRRKAM
jgi:uncharacterized membrane protein